MRDIPESREAMIDWSRVCPLLALITFCVSHSSRQDYEVKNMIPAETNKEVAGYTMAELLSAVPTRFGLWSFAVRQNEGWDDVRIPSNCPTFACSILSSPPQATCSAMVHPRFNAWCHGNKLTAQRWFLLPRIFPSFPVKIDLPKPAGERCPKLHPNK